MQLANVHKQGRTQTTSSTKTVAKHGRQEQGLRRYLCGPSLDVAGCVPNNFVHASRLGKLDEARAAVKAGLALYPRFTIRRYRDVTYASSDNPTYRAGRDREIEGMRLAGVPEG